MTSAVAVELTNPRRRPGLRTVPPQPRRRRSVDDPTRVLPGRRGVVPAHREGECRPGTGCTGHDWLVTAPQQQPRSASIDRVPWGTYHLKENGAIVTACGEFAVSWNVFWGYEVNPLAREACRACMRAMRGQLIDVAMYPRQDRHVD
jgi:hypothetical protein